MKRIISIFFIFSSVLFASTIELSGEYSQRLGNPFKVLLEKKDKTITVFSNKNDVVLSVKSNLDRNSIYNRSIYHPGSYTVKNSSVVNVLKQFYGEKYFVRVSNNFNVLVNILSGKVNLSYNNFKQMHRASHLRSVKVDLNVEIVIDGKRIEKSISMDNKLGITGDDYNWTIQRKVDFNIDKLDETIQNIIEYEIYVLLSTLKD